MNNILCNFYAELAVTEKIVKLVENMIYYTIFTFLLLLRISQWQYINFSKTA